MIASILCIGATHKLTPPKSQEDGDTALGVACGNGQAETARVLLNHGATLDYQNKVYTK